MKYEGAFIFETPDETAKSGMNHVKELLEKNGATITSENEIGHKAFTTPINKKTEGFYFHYILEAPVTLLADIRAELAAKEDLLRYILVRSRDLRLRKKRGKPRRETPKPEPQAVPEEKK